MAISLPANRWIIWTLFVALLLPIGFRLERQIQDALELPRGTHQFKDFQIFLSAVKGVQKGQPLYRTDRPDFFDPGSAVYKYPPPYAGILFSFATAPRWKPVARGLYYANLGVLALTLGFLLAGYRSSLVRKLLITLVFLAWQPFHESLAGLQLEPIMICLVAAGLAVDRKLSTSYATAFAVGVTAALKVYPVVLGLFYLIRRDWKSIAAAATAGLFLLALSAIPLSLRECWYYFTDVLPGLGGTSLVTYNVSVLAGVARATLRLVVDAEAFDGLTSIRTLSVLENSGMNWLTVTSKLLLLAISALLVSSTALQIRRAGRRRTTGSIGFFCSICLMTLLIPTSWVDYQTWLILPMAYLIHHANSRVSWVFLVVSALPAVTINSLDLHYLDHQWIFSFARGLIPLALWAGIIDTLRGEPAKPAHLG